MNDSSVIADYESNRTTIKSAINQLLWNEAGGLYNDNTTTTLHPQDGNVWAIMAGVPENTTQIERILSGLKARWSPFGPQAVEVWIYICEARESTNSTLLFRQVLQYRPSSAVSN